jgi:hypothetical protein
MHSLRSCFFVLISLLAMHGIACAEGRIVKWVDEKGITHYGDTVPPQYSGRDSSEINKQGRIVKQNKGGNIQSKAAVEAEPEIKANLEQQRHDRALLAAYTTSQEFDLARDRNLQTDEATVEGLQQHKDSVKQRRDASKKIADRFIQRKKPAPADILEDIKGSEAEIVSIDAQIKARQQNMAATRQRFDTDKERFIELKRDPNAPPPTAKTPAVVAPLPEAAATDGDVKPGAASEKPAVAPTSVAPAKTSPVPAVKSVTDNPAPQAKPKIKRVVTP